MARCEDVGQITSLPVVSPPILSSGSEEDVEARHTHQAMGMGAIILIAALVADQLRVVFSFGVAHTDEDQTLLWYAGRQLLSGQLREPNFYGQRYNTVFEALPGGLLHLAGLPWGTAVPLATAILATLAWLALAAGAYARGQPLAALLALAAPVLMRVQYLMLFDAPRGVMAGDLAAAVAIAIALGTKRPQARLSALVALGGLAILWDYAAALAVTPALVYFVCADWPSHRRHLARSGLVAVVAAVPPAAWLAYDDSWYAGHRSFLIYPSVNIQPHLSVLFENLHSLATYVTFFAPTLTPIAAVASVILILALGGIILFALRRSALPLLLATCSLIVVICFALSLTRASEAYADLYLSGSRILLPLPMGMWFLAFGVGEATAIEADPGRPRLRLYVAGLVAVTLVSLLAGQATFSAVSARAVSADLEPSAQVTVRNPAVLTTQCTAITRLYHKTKAQLLATNDRVQVYGCAVEDDINTLAPGLERRGWVLDGSAQQPISRILAAVPSCRYVEHAAGRCTFERPGFVLVRSLPRPAENTLHHVIGLDIYRVVAGELQRRRAGDSFGT
jgi:hypothetical protein